MSRIHVAIASTTSLPGQVVRNLAQIRAFARQAGREGADLLLTPEMSASGYGPYRDVLATAEAAGDGPIYRRLAAVARENGLMICAGFVEREGDKRYLAHYAVYPGGKFVVQRKNRVTLLERPLDPSGPLIPRNPARPSPDPADPGQPRKPSFTLFSFKGVRCIICICADAGIPRVNDLFAANGVQLVLAPVGAGGARKNRLRTAELRTSAGRKHYLEEMQKLFFPGGALTDCLKYRRALAAVNMCGYDGRRHHHAGHGFIVNAMGEAPAFFHGLPNLDRQRPSYTHAVIDTQECLPGDG